MNLKLSHDGFTMKSLSHITPNYISHKIICLFLLGSSVFGLFSCELLKKTNGKKDRSEAAPTESIVALSSGNIASLDVNVSFPRSPVDIETSAGLIRVKNIPEGANLECDLSGLPLSQCADGSALLTPKNPGNYRLNIYAILDQKITGEGHFEFLVVSKEKNNRSIISPEEEKDPLKLGLKNISAEGFQWNKNEEDISIPFTTTISGIVIDFGFRNENKCSNELTYFCRLGPSQSVWFLCDSNQKLKIDRKSLGMGQHFAEIEARCGERVGPRLKVSFQMVEEGYQHLALRKITDDLGKSLVILQKESDCLNEDRRFECRESPEQNFSGCPKANILEKLKAPIELRLRCRETLGPSLKIQPTK
jgi:hypothetical protein